MGLRGEVHDLVVLGDELGDGFRVADVSLDEGEAVRVPDLLQIGEVSGVGEFVEHRDRHVRRAVRAEQGTDVVGADEAGSAGDQGAHRR
jgi:hypothetical protein